MNPDLLESKLDLLDARLGRIERVSEPKVEAERAIQGKIKQISDDTDVSEKDVEKVLNQLALPGLLDNLVETSQIREIVDEGRLALSIYAHRKIISA